jgi:hypothetical protein
LCELDDAARAQRLEALERAEPALAARLRRLLEIDVAYGAHTARNVMGSVDAADPVGDISDIGPFRLLRQIGRGGMGVVYLGERRSDFEQQVAIKIMPRFTADAAARARFAQERRILAQLRHPNICSILDGGELDDGTPWLAMEFVPGETLCAWSAARGLDARERIGLFLQLCDAVQYAHRNLVIHRDLKDSNVLVDEAGHVKLLDFGIAKSLAPTEGDGHTALQDRFFSPMTAAPEQIRGERVPVAAASAARAAARDPGSAAAEDERGAAARTHDRARRGVRRHGGGKRAGRSRRGDRAARAARRTRCDRRPLPAQGRGRTLRRGRRSGARPARLAVRTSDRDRARRPAVSAGQVPAPQPAAGGAGRRGRRQRADRAGGDAVAGHGPARAARRRGSGAPALGDRSRSRPRGRGVHARYLRVGRPQPRG